VRPDRDKLEDWASFALQWASGVLEANPPGSPGIDARADALRAIDDVLHIGTASELRPVQQFYQSSMSRAVRQIQAERVDSGAIIWKMYNHGFVIKTPGATIGIDLIKGYGGTTMGGELAAKLAREVQFATISHWHEDHADLDLSRSISDSGGQILVPQDLLERWSPKEGLKLVEMVPGKGYDAAGIRFEAIEGHHDGPPDNCDVNMYYLLTREGLSVLHTGDHWINRRMPLAPSDEASLENLHQDYPVDVLLVNRSPYQFRTIIGKIKPLVAISSHENELSHDLASRATYASSIEQMASIQTPCFTMAWGERFVFKSRMHRPQT